MDFHMQTSTMIGPRKHSAARHAYRILVMLAVLGPITAAHASLGGNAASVETDRVQMKVARTARLTPSANGNYTVHETMLPTATLVRQYVSNTGRVFAVTWNGPYMPDLRQLMGTHFDTMIARQAGKVHAGQRAASQHGSDLVVEAGGHPRHFVGRAYLPSALPAGVTEKDIQP